jgi:hypothetical protein
MPQNALPSGIYDLMQLAENMARGLEKHGRGIKLGSETPELRPAFNELREAERAFASQRSEKAAAGKWAAASDAALKDWLAKARLAVMLARGIRWSEMWIEAGFTHRRTNVPKALAPRIELARRLVDFLSSYPQFGVAHANVTATHGRKLYDDVITARQVYRQLTAACNEAKRVRDGAERRLRRDMRSIVILLGVAIRPDDPRWLEFGLNQPAKRSNRQSPDNAVPKSEITTLPPLDVDNTQATTAAA